MTDIAAATAGVELDPDVRVLHASALEVRREGRAVLADTSLTLRTGEVVVAVGEPGHGHTALALALAGRLPLTAGHVDLDGAVAKDLRHLVALVDVPGVSAPDASASLRHVIAEEMAFAGQRAGRRSVRTWLADQSIEDLADHRIEDVPSGVRTRVLAGLAACRPGVLFLVLVLPERHGGMPETWMSTARALAGVGFGVLVTASPTAAAQVHPDLLQWIGEELR